MNQHMWQGYQNPPRCECHDCTQARYRMSNPFIGNSLSGGIGILGEAQGINPLLSAKCHDLQSFGEKSGAPVSGQTS